MRGLVRSAGSVRLYARVSGDGDGVATDTSSRTGQTETAVADIRNSLENSVN
jgi:hypothetical protein